MCLSFRLKALFLIPLLSVLILSCGGGGSGGNGDLVLPGVSDATVTLQLVDSVSAVTSTVTDDTVTYLSATLSDASGDPIEDASVAFQLLSDIGRLVDTAASVSATTNSSGVAQAELLAGYTDGSGSARVTYSDSNGDLAVSSVSFTSLGDEPDPDPDAVVEDVEVEGSSTSSSAAITLSMVDADGASAGTSGNPITITSPGVLTARLLNAQGAALANEVITFTTTIGTLSPATQLTDSSGDAAINVNADDSSGAGTVTASATVGDDTVTVDLNFVIGAQSASTDVAMSLQDSLGVSAGTIDNPVSSINPGVLRVTLTDASGDPVTSQVVTFVTDIGTVSPATQLTDSTGVATVALTAGDTAGAGTITASTAIGFDTFSDAISIVVSEQSASAEGTAIEFVNASPASITLQGTGGAGLKESSVVTFKVVDTDGQPVTGQAVIFSLTTTLGGLAIANSTDTSDVNGNVTVTVNSGTIPTVVRISASFTDSGGDAVSVFSDQLIVSTGLPVQSRFSVVVSNLSPQAGSHDGVTVDVTAFASDHAGNPAPDGTAVYFTTELGLIGSNCTLVSGSCSVTWTSVDARDGAVDSSVGGGSGGLNDRFGRSTILGVAIGEESFIDNNADGVFDSTGAVPDTVVEQLGEAFRDDNNNGVFDGGAGSTLDEEFRDYNVSGSFDAPNALYDGSRCSDAAETAGHCASLVEVRDSSVITMSTDVVYARFVTDCGTTGIGATDFVEAGGTNPPQTWGNTDLSGLGGLTTINPFLTTTFGLLVSDSNGNAPPGGTTFALSIAASTGGSLSSSTSSFTTSTGGNNPVCSTIVISPPTLGSELNSVISVLVTLPDAQVRGGGFTLPVQF